MKFISPGVSSMSGSIWKGVKVRVGDAKPDFDQQLWFLTIDAWVVGTVVEDGMAVSWAPVP